MTLDMTWEGGMALDEWTARRLFYSGGIRWTKEQRVGEHGVREQTRARDSAWERSWKQSFEQPWES